MSTGYRRTWASRIRRSLEGCTFQFSLGLLLFEEGYDLDFFGFLIALPFLDRWRYEPEEMLNGWWGFYFNGGRWPWEWDSFVWRWGSKCTFWHLPWEFVHINDAHQVRRPDGLWVVCTNTWDSNYKPDGREIFTLPYRYTLRNGDVQERTATFHVERREWRRKWTRWCPWFAKKAVYIDIQFSDEVGEGAGSWKGGCIGCSYDMKPGETPQDTLRRMQLERKF